MYSEVINTKIINLLIKTYVYNTYTQKIINLYLYLNF